MPTRNERESDGGGDGRVSVVVATRDRRESLAQTLERLARLPERPRVVVVDNDSSDGTSETVRGRFPDVDVIALRENLGPAARTVGARHVDTPYVAFSDDDSWWGAGSLARAADLLDSYPRLALVAARVLVGDDGREDPTSREMRRSPLTTELELPGPPVLGFVACGAVVRRRAFLEVGGFHDGVATGAEESLLAVDLATRAWGLAYVDDVVACHDPSPRRDPATRRRAETRNELSFAWLRRPLGVAVRQTAAAAGSAVLDRAARRGLLDVLRDARRLVRERRVVPPEIEAGLRELDL